MQRVRKRRKRAAGGIAFGTGVALAASEALHWRATRRFLPSVTNRTTGPGDDVVLVLGFPSRANGLHPMQQWRIDIAVRSMDRSRGLLLVSGGSRKHGRCEADDMAAYARDAHGVPAEQVLVEREARSTWENVEHCLPLLEAARTITVASSPLHAARGRGYVVAQRAGLAGRLRPADDHRWGERSVWKALTVAYQLVLLLRLRPRRPVGV